MLHTLSSLGVNPKITENALKLVKNNFGKYENIYFSDIEDIYDVLIEACSRSRKRGKECIGFVVFLDNTVNSVCLGRNEREVAIGRKKLPFSVIKEFCDDYKPRACAILQQVDKNEYRVITDDVYELQGKVFKL